MRTCALLLCCLTPVLSSYSRLQPGHETALWCTPSLRLVFGLAFKYRVAVVCKLRSTWLRHDLRVGCRPQHAPTRRACRAVRRARRNRRTRRNRRAQHALDAWLPSGSILPTTAPRALDRRTRASLRASRRWPPLDATRRHSPPLAGSLPLSRVAAQPGIPCRFRFGPHTAPKPPRGAEGTTHNTDRPLLTVSRTR